MQHEAVTAEQQRTDPNSLVMPLLHLFFSSPLFILFSALSDILFQAPILSELISLLWLATNVEFRLHSSCVIRSLDTMCSCISAVIKRGTLKRRYKKSQEHEQSNGAAFVWLRLNLLWQRHQTRQLANGHGTHRDRPSLYAHGMSTTVHSSGKEEVEFVEGCVCGGGTEGKRRKDKGSYAGR